MYILYKHRSLHRRDAIMDRERSIDTNERDRRRLPRARAEVPKWRT